MREIKFRAWDKDDEVMRGWNELILEKSKGDNFYLLGHEVSTVETNYYHEQILMQYTGLKDKNGKEIYEGDIVKFLNIRTKHERWEIRYARAQFILVAGSTYFPLSTIDLDFVEVIGNKHENPELL